MISNKKIYKHNFMLPNKLKSILSDINEVIKHKNIIVYLVGGCVRDLLLGLENLDLDFVTLDDGLNFAKMVHKRMGGKLTVHNNFRTGSINLGNRINIDIVTARKEYYEEPGKLPKVEFGSLLDDLIRRDFTMNTLLLDFKNLDNPIIYDYFDGVSDLYNKKIRVLHDNSFIDDPTRIYRAVRFTCRYNFEIEDNTLKLINKALKNNVLTSVSEDRLFTEIIKGIKERNSYKVLKKYDEFNLFSFISNTMFINNVIIDKFNNLEQINKIKKGYKFPQISDTEVKIMILFHNLKEKELQNLLEKLSLKKDTKKKLLELKENYGKTLNILSKPNLSSYELYKTLNKKTYEEILYYLIMNYNDNIIRSRIYQYTTNFKNKKLLIDGKDIKDLGVKEGPIYKKILDIMLKETLNNNLNTKEKQLKVLKEVIKNNERSDYND
ncbi:CCA tRNA nucleotidyltransferase [Thermohalobacter berrensis]|uniref:Polynucleotide adenylyltransferase n=1 Tax=Thermohalobacter berrensis TaxID=99594 RepID=A0A419TAP9_9FIRM|nr:CCA tRNA nucleotidyltransferase [Thermohalobacter berrensis]RKD34545.1 hypothetical protein BET03_01580 [Thermohalobacter berrensis]